jgi:NAD(P)-dependent dehydrogenase (short-subunit alcohol dehydrogenase family)
MESLTAERINRCWHQRHRLFPLLPGGGKADVASARRQGRGDSECVIGGIASGGAGEYVDYAASKGAVDTLTTGLSLEVAAQGIRVNGVRPGFIYTDMHASGGEPGAWIG